MYKKIRTPTFGRYVIISTEDPFPGYYVKDAHVRVIGKILLDNCNWRTLLEEYGALSIDDCTQDNECRLPISHTLIDPCPSCGHTERYGPVLRGRPSAMEGDV